MCYKWQGLCYVCCNHNPDVYSFMILLIVAIVTRPVSQIKQELITLVEHYNSPVVLCRVPFARSLVFCVMSLFALFVFFGHCIVLPSSIYCFWIPICNIKSFLTFIFILVLDVKQCLNYPPFSMHFSDLLLLFEQLIIRYFLCTRFKYFWTYANRIHLSNSLATMIILIIYINNMHWQYICKTDEYMTL